jgi:phosphoglycerate dehydrogenase-like enzyme
MGLPTVLWCWIDAPWVCEYLPPDRVQLRILSTRGASDPETDLAELAKDADAIVVRRYFQVTRKVIQGAARLKFIQRLGRITGNIDLAAARDAKVPVGMLAMGLDMAVAEHVFMFMLALSRRLLESHQAVVRGDYRAHGRTPTVTTERTGLAECWIPMPTDALFRKTLGIVGMGEIGRAVAERAQAFGMRVLYYTRSRLPEAEEAHHGIEYASLETLLAASDFVTLHVPHTAETSRMIGERELASMKPSAFLVNVSRGGLIDEAALCKALAEHRIAGAGLDVFEREPVPADSPLLQLDNVLCTPHSAAIYPQGSNIVQDVQRACENVFSVLEGHGLVHGHLAVG